MAVDTKDEKIRFVRCPKCSEILIEPTDAPVYQCGGCSAVLQAKHYNVAGENCSSGSIEIEQSNNSLASGSADKGTNLKGKEITGLSNVNDSEAAHIADQSVSLDLDFSSFRAGYNCHERGESSASGVDEMKEEEVSSSDQFESRNDAEYTSKSPPDGSTQTKTDHCLKVEADESLKCSQQISNDLMPSEKSEECQKLSDGCILATSDHSLKEAAEKGSENSISNDTSAPPKSSECKESGMKEGSDTGQSSFRGNAVVNATIPQHSENIATDTGYCLTEEVEKSQKQSKAVSSEILEESSESESQAVVTENNLVDESHGSVNSECLSSPIRISQTYDDSVFSRNRTGDCAGDKYIQLSSRSFRNLDIKEMRGDVSKSVEIPGPSLKISNQENNGILGSSMGGLFSKRTRPRERGTSLDSSAFHSVENRMGYTGYSRPLTRGSTFQGDSLNCNSGHPSAIFKHLEQDHLELLNIVAELRDQLGDIQCKRGGEKRTQFGRIPSLLQPVTLDPKPGQQFRKSIPRPPRTHYEFKSSLSQQHLLPLDGPCSCLDCRLEERLSFLPNFRACACNICSRQSHLQIGSNVPLCCQKAQTHDLKLEKLQRENRQPLKRYCRPLSGCAPFVICYRCFQVLQLPADFVISRKRSKKLQCGACFKTLLFSFPAGARLTQNPIQGFHSAKEVDSGSVASTGQEIVSTGQETSVFSSDGCPLGGDPISSSEEHELSFRSSCSTMDESVLNVSKNSFIKRNDKRLTSKLHRLMGYSSATEVLYQPNNYSDEEYELIQG